MGIVRRCGLSSCARTTSYSKEGFAGGLSSEAQTKVVDNKNTRVSASRIISRTLTFRPTLKLTPLTAKPVRQRMFPAQLCDAALNRVMGGVAEFSRSVLPPNRLT